MATNVRGYEKIREKFQSIRAGLSLPMVQQQVGALLLRRNLERFDKEMDPTGKRWKPLNPATLQRRARGDVQGRLLNRSGALRNAIALIQGGANTVYANTGAGIRIGVKDEEIVPRAMAHQKGTRHIPIRRFLGVGSTDVQVVGILLRKLGDKAVGG